jgi:hypothetical protein
VAVVLVVSVLLQWPKKSSGQEAIRQLDGQEVSGRQLVVNVAKERQESDRTGDSD